MCRWPFGGSGRLAPLAVALLIITNSSCACGFDSTCNDGSCVDLELALSKDLLDDFEGDASNSFSVNLLQSSLTQTRRNRDSSGVNATSANETVRESVASLGGAQGGTPRATGTGSKRSGADSSPNAKEDSPKLHADKAAEDAAGRTSSRFVSEDGPASNQQAPSSMMHIDAARDQREDLDVEHAGAAATSGGHAAKHGEGQISFVQKTGPRGRRGKHRFPKRPQNRSSRYVASPPVIGTAFQPPSGAGSSLNAADYLLYAFYGLAAMFFSAGGVMLLALHASRIPLVHDKDLPLAVPETRFRLDSLLAHKCIPAPDKIIKDTRGQQHQTSFTIPLAPIYDGVNGRDSITNSFEIAVQPATWPLRAILTQGQLNRAWDQIELLQDVAVPHDGLPALLCDPALEDPSAVEIDAGCVSGASGVEDYEKPPPACLQRLHQRRLLVNRGSDLPSWKVDMHADGNTVAIRRDGLYVALATYFGGGANEDDTDSYLQLDLSAAMASPDIGYLLISVIAALAFDTNIHLVTVRPACC